MTKRKKGEGDGGSAAQKLAHGALPDGVRVTKKSSTPVASGTTTEKGASDKDKPTTNRNLAQGKESNAVRTATSYFDPVWNAFSKHTDGSMQWIPKQIVAIGEDFHNQVGDGKIRTTLYKVRWEGYDKKDDSWEPITHLQGYATMVKSFKESHAKDLEKHMVFVCTELSLAVVFFFFLLPLKNLLWAKLRDYTISREKPVYR